MVSLINANDSDISVISSGSVKTVVRDTQVESPSTIRNNTFKTPVKRKCICFFFGRTSHFWVCFLNDVLMTMNKIVK